MFGRPMNLKLAAPRVKQRFAPSMTASYDPMTYYQQYQQFYNSAAWQMYDFNSAADPHKSAIAAEKEKAAAYRRALGGRWAETPSSSKSTSISEHSTMPAEPAGYLTPGQIRILDENQMPEEFDLKLGSADKENELYMAQSEELYDTLEESNWFLINNARFHEKDLPEIVE